jgi:hypothetical protein
LAPKKRFLLRIDEDLYRRLEHWAADEFRSVNGQIEFLLRNAVRGAGRLRSSEDAGRDREPGNSVGEKDE